MERRANTLLFHTADQIRDATVQIKESLEDVQKGAVLDPQERDTNRIGPPTMDALGPVNPLHLGPKFTPVELQQLDLLPLLQKVPEVTRDRIT